MGRHTYRLGVTRMAPTPRRLDVTEWCPPPIIGNITRLPGGVAKLSFVNSDREERYYISVWRAVKAAQRICSVVRLEGKEVNPR